MPADGTARRLVAVRCKHCLLTHATSLLRSSECIPTSLFAARFLTWPFFAVGSWNEARPCDLEGLCSRTRVRVGHMLAQDWTHALERSTSRRETCRSADTDVPMRAPAALQRRYCDRTVSIFFRVSGEKIDIARSQTLDYLRRRENEKTRNRETESV